MFRFANLPRWERLLRIGGGVVMLVGGAMLIVKPGSIMLLAGGIAALLTGIVAWCPVCAIAGRSRFAPRK